MYRMKTNNRDPTSIEVKVYLMVSMLYSAHEPFSPHDEFHSIQKLSNNCPKTIGAGI
jgi:hypothetical protein